MITFKQFIFETSDGLSAEDIADIIKRDCQPWIKKSEGHQVFRGMTVGKSGFEKFVDPHSTDLVIVGVRNDRNPSASPMWLHNAMNEYFKSAIGIPLRSACIFTVGSPSVASEYVGAGNLYSIYPIGDFNYAWSPLVYDPTMEFYSTVSSSLGFSPRNSDLKYKFDKFWANNYKSFPETKNYPTSEKYFSEGKFRVATGNNEPKGYEKMVAKFMMDEPLWKFNTRLTDAIDIYSTNEIMITCNKYYAVPIKMSVKVNTLL